MNKTISKKTYFFFLSFRTLVTAAYNSLYLFRRAGSMLDGVTTGSSSSVIKKMKVTYPKNEVQILR